MATPNKNHIEARFTFPRQPAGERLCLADYFAPVESGQVDVVALQVVTVGAEATERFDRLQPAGDYSEAYYLHGLAVQTAEATAEYLHRHIRRELGLAEGQGKRYSWGYPAIPELGIAKDSQREVRAIDGIGRLRMRIDPTLYHAWGTKYGYDCWKDSQFLKEVERDNPEVRVRCGATRLQVGFTGGTKRSSQKFTL